MGVHVTELNDDVIYVQREGMNNMKLCLYFFEGCLRAMQRAICWQKVSGVPQGKMRVSSSLEHTALKYGLSPPTMLFSLYM